MLKVLVETNCQNYNFFESAGKQLELILRQFTEDKQLGSLKYLIVADDELLKTVF